MKFATAKEHRDFFQKQGWIEFEGLISQDQFKSANQAIDQVLTERLNVHARQFNLSSSEKLYLQGRDLWRSNAFLQKFATYSRFAEITAELIEKKPLRSGYDQFLPACPLISQEDSYIYTHFLEQTASLESVSCLQRLGCGLIIALSDKESIEEEVSKGIDIFPNQSGNVIFFQPHLSINWKNLYAHPKQRFYLVTYTLASAYYQLVNQDPHTHSLKRSGYIFNDKLNDKLNPIVYR